MEMMQLSVTVGSSFAPALFQAFLHKSDHLDKNVRMASQGLTAF